LPAELHYVGKGVFENCVSLSQVVLNENIQVVPPRLFSGCHSLAHIVVPTVKPPRVVESPFSGVNLKTLIVHVDAEFLSAYKQDVFWGTIDNYEVFSFEKQ